MLFGPVEYHACMVEDVINELPVGSEAGVVPIIDVVAAHLIPPLICAFPVSSRFVIATVRQKFMTNATVCCHPHPHIGVMFVRRTLHKLGICRVDHLGETWLGSYDSHENQS